MIVTILIDINECDEHSSGCNQICTNTIGGFTCSCYNGFTFSEGSITFCEGKVLTIIYIHNYCTVALCDDSCGNCASCDSPNNCTCSSGWTGSDCCIG